MTNILRPVKFEDIIGQEEIIHRLKISISAAKTNGHTMGHVLLDGGSGLGKSTLAGALANELGTTCYTMNGGNIRTPADLLPTLLKISEGDVLFIDEIHRLPINIEEWLYIVMEDLCIAQTGDDMNLEMKPFTMIGATTQSGNLSRPFRDRFTYIFMLRPYKTDELAQIVHKSLEKLGIESDMGAAENIARRARGTPRIVNKFAIWLRDYCQSSGCSCLTDNDVDAAMQIIGVDEIGMDERDKAYLEAFNGIDNPIGLKSLADKTGIDKDTIENVIEPFLISLDLIVRTPRGRTRIEQVQVSRKLG